MSTSLLFPFAGARVMTTLAAVGLSLALQGCISDHSVSGSTSGSSSGSSSSSSSSSSGGGSSSGSSSSSSGGTVTACANLPAAVTNYKGGDALGEELTLSLDPSTLAYTVTIDASVQRTAGALPSDTLQRVSGCTYGSAASGATFTLGAGGVVQGAVTQPGGKNLTPLLAFQNSFSTTSTSSTAYSSVANIFDLVAVAYDGTGPTSYGASVRLRNAGTFQLCQDPTAGFMIYAAGCAMTAKGYILFNTTRNAFDVFTTPADGGAVTTGGTLSGSMVIGLVNNNAVPLQLFRASATSTGMALATPQASLASGAADGSYDAVDLSGISAEATIAGTAFTHGGASATLTYDTPVLGVVQSGSAVSGNLVYSNGIYGFVSLPAATPAVFELGLQH